MGHDLGRVVLVHCRGFLTAGALAAVLVGSATAPAAADDPTPGPDPLSTPFSTPLSAPVPTPVVSPPSQQQIDDAKAALDRLRNQGKNQPTSLSRVAGPTARPDSGGVTSRISDQAWWTMGAGALVLLVASETTRLSVRRAKHRKGA
jgi:hypothetical protein